MLQRALLLFLLITNTPFSFAFDFERGSIDIPANFEGPISEKLAEQLYIHAFKKEHGDGTGTLLQFSIYKPDSTFVKLTQSQIKDATRHYLLEFVKGIEKERKDFRQSKIIYTEISGVPVATVAWTGVANDKKLQGIMYCYIIGSQIVSIHIQDFIEFNSKYIDQAVKAIESMIIK